MGELLFGTDGVRGLAGSDLTRELAFDLGRAAVGVLGRHGEGRPTVVVGRDTRGSGEWLEDALVEGILAAGGDAILAGVEPTPAIAYLTTSLGAAAGAVISASHNPPEYNGIKFFDRSGTKLPDALEDEIETALGTAVPGGIEPGSVRQIDGSEHTYLDHLVSASEARLDGMTVVVDCANGAASAGAPQLLRLLGASVHAIYSSPDGTNINDGCGALHPEVVAAEVVRIQAHAGVAFDGDADRALFADGEGNVIDGDQVLTACALDLHERGALANDTLVVTVMSNLGLFKAMERAGIDVIAASVGDRYVLEEMQRTGAELGGEQSGHVIFSRHATTGDGLLTAVRFLGLSARTGASLADLGARMHRFPQVLVNVEIADPSRSEASPEVAEAVRAAEKDLGAGGRVLVRPSGTEPLVRVMVEAEAEAVARRHAETIADHVRSALG
ncbi:MAG: phosphoglucosamine mutase [Actinomycetota bacterium]